MATSRLRHEWVKERERDREISRALRDKHKTMMPFYRITCMELMRCIQSEIAVHARTEISRAIDDSTENAAPNNIRKRTLSKLCARNVCASWCIVGQSVRLCIGSTYTYCARFQGQRTFAGSLFAKCVHKTRANVARLGLTDTNTVRIIYAHIRLSPSRAIHARARIHFQGRAYYAECVHSALKHTVTKPPASRISARACGLWCESQSECFAKCAN